ncbi:MAG TPA: hypothetical protein DER35_01255 [Acidobacteria bacterium]|nr:hypothetical protein [Acidobacteriota bacterium]
MYEGHGFIFSYFGGRFLKGLFISLALILMGIKMPIKMSTSHVFLFKQSLYDVQVFRPPSAKSSLCNMQ